MKQIELKLKKSKEEVMTALGCVLDCYKAYNLRKLKKIYPATKEKVLETYADFYEWLQGKV